MNGPILECLDAGGTVVTASARLARRLQYRHARACLDRGRRAWETPDILPVEAWIERSWREADAEDPARPRLLSRVQSGQLWQDIVAGSRFRARLLQPAAVARDAAAAWNTLQQWCSPPLPADPQLNEDVRAFAAWMREFRERCAAGAWIDPASLGTALRARWQSGHAPPPGRIAFVGFDAPTPMQQALFAALPAAGWRAEWLAAPPRATTPAVLGFADRREETRAAAAWMRGALAGREPPSIGIVVPDLRSRRRMVEEIFDDVLDSGSLLRADDPAGRAWSIARGEPLARHPVVAAALAVLSLGRRRWPLDVAGVLLRSPYLMRSAGEMPALARLDRLLRRRGDAHCDLRTLLRAAGSPAAGAPAIAGRLQRIAALRDALPVRQSPRAWAVSFSKILTASGWPGWRSLNSGEYQAAENWRETLDEFAALDLFGGAWGFEEALSRLAQLAEEDFQPRTGETPVQVLGMEGAADMGFDRLWVMGLEEGTWPPAARPSPFLPMRMQRELAMPDATPEIALQSGRRLTRRLAGCAGEVVFSHPRNEAETPLRISPLIAAWQGGAAPRIEAARDYPREIFAGRAVEWFGDEQAAAIAPDRAARGGAGLLRDQAACPFRAFARHRLAARPVDPVDIGLSAQERGSLLHEVLEAIWGRLGDHAALAGADEPALGQMVGEAVDAAVEAVRLRRPGTVTPRFAEVERARLRKLARGWLELERSRTPFAVEAREQEREIRIGGLSLKLRVDRIDRLPDGRKLILDYKTGDASLAAWRGDRPDDPQLPLYAVTGTDPIAALAFARVTNGGHAFIGAGASADLLPGLVADRQFEKTLGVPGWAELLARWRRIIEGLAAGFRDGGARVDPKSPQSCRECDLHAFCRIQESRPWSGQFDD